MIPQDLIDRNEKLYCVLVEESGPSESSEGEMLRAINMILYRYYADGQYWWSGECFAAGAAAAYLCSDDIARIITIQSLIKESDHVKGKNYVQILCKVLEVIVEFVESKQGRYKYMCDDMLLHEPYYPDDDDDDD
jgi:hypothetical protein